MIAELYFLIYVIVFIVGAVSGLLYSYSIHLEPFVVKEKFNIPILIMAIIGWIFTLNFSLFSMIPSFILISIGVFLIGFVIDMRPGYGRKETIIGMIISILIWLITHCVIL